MSKYSELKKRMAGHVDRGDTKCVFDVEEIQVLIAEFEALRKDAERFAYIERDASSGMSKIYGDDWVAVIDAAIVAELSHD